MVLHNDRFVFHRHYPDGKFYYKKEPLEEKMVSFNPLIKILIVNKYPKKSADKSDLVRFSNTFFHSKTQT